MESTYENSSLCLKEFEALVSKLGNVSQATYLEQMPQREVEEAYGRFRIWLGNLGALQRGHASLDYRVRESTVMKSSIIALLKQLLTNLRESLSIITGTRLPFELMQPDWSSDEESAGSDSDDDEDDDDEGGADGKSELKQRLASIQDILSDLYKLSFKIRNPSTKPKPSKAAVYAEVDDETGVELFSEYQKFDRLYVTELFRQLRMDTQDSGNDGEYLIHRLSCAITFRRRQFRYWRRHGSKLAQDYSTSDDQSQRPHRSSGHELTKDPEQVLKDAHMKAIKAELTPSMISRSIFSGTEATTYDKQLDDLLETQSIISYATTAYDIDGRSVSIPAPPSAASKGNGFVCPYCSILCPAKHGSGRAWRTHILHDLQPYICTYRDCTAQTFSSRRQWLEHEGQTHRKVWRCFQHPSAIFTSAAAYRDHLRSAHTEDYDQRNDVIDVAETYLADERDTCPLCFQKVAPGISFHHHLAYHLETIACFALPKNIQEEDEEGSRAGSNAPQAWSEESRPTLGSERLSYHSSNLAEPNNDASSTGVTEELDLRTETPGAAVQALEVDADAGSDEDLFAVKPRRDEEVKQSVPADPDPSPILEKPISCSVSGCSAQFERMSDFVLHMKQHGTPELPCEFLDCGKKFHRFEDLKEHVFQEHGIAAEITHSLAPLNIAKRVEQSNAGASVPTATSTGENVTETFESSTGPSQVQADFKWMKGGVLGLGSWSKAPTYLGMNASTGELIAIKEIHFSEDSAEKTAEDGRLRMRRELVEQLIEIVSELDHPNVLQYYGYSLKNNTYAIFMEYISGGTLGACAQKYGKFSERMVAHFARQILMGLKYLHGKGIVHRDLTANKVFLDLDGTCKIGWSFMMEKLDNVYASNPTADRRMGSVYWMAPEVVRSEGSSYSGKSDVWSVGCIALELLSGRRPFSKEEIIGAIFKLGHLSQAPPIPDDVSSESGPATLAFLYDCFTIDPSERPTVDLLLARSPFVQSVGNFDWLDSNLYKSIQGSFGEPKEQLTSAEKTSGPLEEQHQDSSIQGQSLDSDVQERAPAFTVGDEVTVPWLTKPPTVHYVSSQQYDKRTGIWLYQLANGDGTEVERGKWFIEKELGVE